MQKWEYLSVIAEYPAGLLDSKTNYHEYKPKFINGQEQKDWKRGSTIDEYMKNLGEQGWELISFTTPVYGVMPIMMVFKRPKP